MKKLFNISRALLFVFLYSSNVKSQTIIGIPGANNCVFQGNSCAYMVNGFTTTATDKWCVSGGTINGTTDSCITNTGLQVINVTWKLGISNGVVAYYTSAANGSPAATISVALLHPGSITATGASYELPYIPANIPLNLTLTGAALSCNVPLAYQWQQSYDGKHYTDIPGATAVNYYISQSFTESVYFRRNVFPAQGANGIMGFSTIALIIKP